MPTCPFCHKDISDDEYVVNWASCSECFDAGYEQYLKEQRMPLDPKKVEEEKEKEEVAESHEGEENDEDDETDDDDDDEGDKDDE